VRPLVGIGVVAVVAGFLVAVETTLASTLSLSSFVLTLVGVLGVLQGLRYTNARRSRDRKTRRTGEPERRESARVPGVELDDDIVRAANRQYRSRGRRGRNTQERVRERVREVAVRAVARERNQSVERADGVVERGEWTDDRVAAAFLSPATSYPLSDRLRGGLFGRPTYLVGVRAAVEAAAAVDDPNGTAAEGATAADDSDGTPATEAVDA